LAHVRQWGRTVILSDGDAVLQPRKIRRTGIWDAVEGRVLIYLHKELMLDDIKERYPAQRYVIIDDKPVILAAMKKAWDAQLTTVFTRQGHYARMSHGDAIAPADVTIEHIGDLIACSYSDFAPSG